MSNKETNLKEKFRIALSSTAKVIADDIYINNKSSEAKKTKDISLKGDKAATTQEMGDCIITNLRKYANEKL